MGSPAAGIVQGTATVKAVVKKQDARSFEIEFPEGGTKAVQQGASVAINGTCLTVRFPLSLPNRSLSALV